MKRMPPTAIGNRIREERDKKGWSLNRLAEETGMLNQTISAIELGVSQNPHLKTVFPVLKALGIPLEEAVELLSGEPSTEAVPST